MPKICIQCGSEFHGRRSDAVYCCNKCGNNYRNSKHYYKNPDKYYARREFYNSNTQKRVYQRVKSRAKTLGIDFDIDPEDIVIPEFCPVLGIKLRENHGRQGYFDDSVSLDRIRPSHGYTKGNVRVISARANLLKNNATIEELETVIKDLKRIWEI